MKQIALGNSLEEGVFINFGIQLKGRTCYLMEKFARSVLKGYDANYYADLAVNQKKEDYKLIARDALKRLEFNYRKDPLFLDIGSGPGILTNEIAKLIGDGKIIGIDASDNMISFAEQYAKNEKVYNAKFIKCQVEELSEYFEPNHYVIISRNTLHRINDGQVALNQVYRLAAERNKPSVYIRDMNRSMPWWLVLEESKSESWSEKSKFERLVENPAFYTPKELKQILKNSKIKNYKIFDGGFDESIQDNFINRTDCEWVLLINK